MANQKRYGDDRAHVQARKAKKAGYKGAGRRLKTGGSAAKLKPVNPTAGARPVRSNPTKGLGGAVRQAGMNVRKARRRDSVAMGDAGLRPPKRKR